MIELMRQVKYLSTHVLNSCYDNLSYDIYCYLFIFNFLRTHSFHIGCQEFGFLDDQYQK